MQHFVHHVLRRNSSAIKSDRVEISIVSALFHWLKPLTDERGKETGVPMKKKSDDEPQKKNKSPEI